MMIGDMVGRYHVLERIGTGGMGEVYLAKDTSLGRKVALKFLSQELLTDEVARKRFVREARSTAALDHPYICSVHEVAQTDTGQDFIVMEYVEGLTLRERLDQGELTVRESLRISLEISEALQEAHKRGIVHRDLKPSNIMLTEGGHAKVMDFGLAKRTEGRSRQEITDVLTREGRALGTLPYMSPEQALGKTVDGRSDIFSFGVIVYELLTRVNPFQKETRAGTSYAILADQPSSVSDYRSDIPISLENTLEKMLRKDVEQRFQNMDDLVVALRAVRRDYRLMLEGRTASEIGVSLDDERERRDEREKSGKWLIWIASACVLALLVGSGFWFWPQRCLWAPGWFGECKIPAYKHIGVLNFESIDGTDEAMIAGLRELVVDQLRLISQSDSTVCSHGIPPHESTLCNLNVEAQVQVTGSRIGLELTLLDPGNALLLRRCPVESQFGTLQDELAPQLAEMLEMDLSSEAMHLTARGGTGIPTAFLSYVRGMGLLELDRCDEAMTEFSNAIEEDSHYAAAYSGLARAYWRSYRESKNRNLLVVAKENALRAIELSSVDPIPSAYEVLGYIHRDLGEISRAHEALEEAVRLCPLNAHLRMELGNVLLSLEQEEQAENVIQAGVDLRPNCWFVHDIIGYFYSKRGKFREAERHYRRVVEVAPENWRGYHVLAGVQYAQEDWSEAEQSFGTALRIRPGVATYLSLGQLYIRLNCARSAIATLEKATSLGKDVYLAWGNKAEAYLLLPKYRSRAPGIFAKAIQLAEKELIHEPNNPQVHRMLAFYRARMGQRELAVQGIQRALKIDPNDIRTVYRAGYLYELVGERDRAVEFFTRALQEGSSSWELCDNEDLEGLRRDIKIAGLLEGTCKQDRTAFVCPEDRPAVP